MHLVTITLFWIPGITINRGFHLLLNKFAKYAIVILDLVLTEFWSAAKTIPENTLISKYLIRTGAPLRKAATAYEFSHVFCGTKSRLMILNSK